MQVEVPSDRDMGFCTYTSLAACSHTLTLTPMSSLLCLLPLCVVVFSASFPGRHPSESLQVAPVLISCFKSFGSPSTGAPLSTPSPSFPVSVHSSRWLAAARLPAGAIRIGGPGLVGPLTTVSCASLFLPAACFFRAQAPGRSDHRRFPQLGLHMISRYPCNQQLSDPTL